MRPVLLMERPVFIPYTCAVCGVGGGAREWFIDIGIDNDASVDLRSQGAIYFCNICVFNFITEVHVAVSKWEEEHGRSDNELDSSTSELEPSSDGSVEAEQLSSDTSEQTASVPESDDDEHGFGIKSLSFGIS
jgi:hypothetical protein